MKKHRFDFIILLGLQLIFLLLHNPGFSQIITIGTSTSSTSVVPTNTDMKYSYSQQIFTSAEVTQNGTICGISLRTTTSDLFSRTLKIYLGHTTKNSFISSTDWISSSLLTQVFYGSVTLVNNNWINITFDTPFSYNGTDNLVIAIDDNTQIDTSSTTFQYTSSTSKVLYYNSLTVNPSITAPPSGTISSNRNNVKIHFCSPTSMTNTPLSTCDLLYSDPNGMNNYGNNQNFTQTITASTLPNNHLIVDFMELSIGLGDTLWVYDGANTASPLQGMYTNVVYPNQFSATGTAVTFRFKSDNSSTSIGWLAHIYCSTCDAVSILLGSPCHTVTGGYNGFAANPFCTDENPYGITFPSATAGNGNVFLTTPVGCLTSVLRPAWYFMQINTPGNMLINIIQTSTSGSGSDVDFACWGPFFADNQTDFMDRLCCGEYELYRSSGSSHRPSNGNHTNNMGGYPINNLIDCSYAADYTEWCYIPNAQSGQFYILLITNYNGNPGTITFNTVQQYTTATTDCSLLAQVSNNGPICSGSTIQLTCNNPQPNATYLWNGPNGFSSTLPNPIISNATASNSGIYSLVITVNGQSSAPANTNVVVNPIPNVSLSATATNLCQGNATTMNVSGATSYVWSNSLGTGISKTVNPSTTSTYTVTGTSLGCSDTAQITINVHLKPLTQLNTPNPTYCPNIGSIVVLTNTTPEGGFYTYNWLGNGINCINNDTTQLTVNPNDCNELYRVIVTATDQNGCFDKDTAYYQVLDTTPPVLNNQPFPIQTATGTYPNYSIPDFSTLVLNNCSDNCYNNNLLVYNQIPAAGTIITNNTYVQVTVTDPCGNSKMVIIRVILPLYATFSDSVNVSCYNGNNGSATLTINGGISPYLITLNGNTVQNAQTFTSLVAGTYQATITDSLGTSVTTTVTISQPPVFTTQLTDPISLYCPNTGSIPIICSTSGGSGLYQYNWIGNNIVNVNNDSTFLNVLSNDCNELYEAIIVATDQAGCIARDTTFIQVIDTVAPLFNSLPFANQTLTGIFPDYIVPDYSALVLANTTDNCTPNNLITYSQSIIAGTSISSSTYLQVTVTDQCGNSRSANIRLLIPLYGVITTSTNVTCYNGNNGTSTVSVSGGILPYTFSWSTNPVQHTATVGQLTAGNYQVTITDSTGTTIVIPVQITQPNVISVTSSINVPTCQTNSGSIQLVVSGGVIPYTYLWNNGMTSSLIENLGSGIYTCTVTDANGCTKTKSDTVVTSNPLIIEETTSIMETCDLQNGSISVTLLNGTPPYHYQWNNGVTTGTALTNLNSGYYYITVTDQNQCEDTTSILVDLFDIQSFIDHIAPSKCGGNDGSITLRVEGGTGNYEFNWNNINDFNNNYAFNLGSGQYTVFIKDQDCIDTINFLINEIHKPVACFETSTNNVLLINQSFLATNCSQYATEYHWNFGDGATSQVENPTHFYNESGLKYITLTATNNYNCVDSVTHSILVNEVSIMYIPNSFTPNGDGINDTFLPVCSFVKEDGYSIRIFNRWGQEVFFSNDLKFGWDGTYNGLDAPSGTYSYVIIYENLFGQPFRKVGSINILR